MTDFDVETLRRRFTALALTNDGRPMATGLIERLGLTSAGGVLRIGLTHYNTAAEIDLPVEALARIAAPAASSRTPATV